MIIDDCDLKVFSPITPDFVIVVDTEVYGRHAVLRACYAFAGYCYVWLELEDRAKMKLSFKCKSNKYNIEQLKGEFANSLVDFALRQEIEAKTNSIRSVIVRTALAEATAKPLDER
jgi:His-Xaa-Ser system protein HxsD